MDRLSDYGLVLIVVLAVMGLFRLSRFILNRLMDRMAAANRQISRDEAIFAGMIFLLSGLLFLPFITALISFVRNDFLPGGIVLHLIMVAISVIVFSISEDLFRVYRNFSDDPKGGWSFGRHMKRLSLPLLVFWAIGCIFLSPLFYSGLTIILALFYAYAVGFCRTDGQKTIT